MKLNLIGQIMSKLVYLNYFTHHLPSRQWELDLALINNISNKYIDKIIVLYEEKEKPKITSDKIILELVTERPLFNYIFNLTRKYSREDDFNIIINSDIYLDESIELINKMNSTYCYALTRWEVRGDGRIEFFEHLDSQDVWIFKGSVPQKVDAEFFMGRKGCDNRLAAILSKYYSVRNPSLSIKCYHLHATEVRTYYSNKDTDSNRILGEYRLLQYKKIEDC